MDQREHIKRLNHLIEDVEFAMLTTAQPDGTLRSRPMATQQCDESGNLWFFTEMNSGKVAEAQTDPHVNVSYASPEDQTYVSVSGTCEIVRDMAKMKELWNPLYKAWFPKGLDDPEIALMKIHITDAEYWDSPNGTMVQLAGFVKAIATGTPYKADEDEHAKIDFEGKKSA